MPLVETWPGASQRRPSLSSITYGVRAPLSGWVESEARRARADYGDACRVLDVGCGIKPYYPYFASFASGYTGVDVANPAADLQGTAEALPVEDAGFDVVLCTQVLEHSPDPARAVAELSRVTAPGGRVLASTHGVQVYHPAPDDLWRWTHTGLARLFEQNGEWASVTVRPGAGTTACLGAMIAHYVDLLARRAHVTAAGRAVVWAVNRGAAAIDGRSTELREPGPGTLFLNYHVVAEKP